MHTLVMRIVMGCSSTSGRSSRAREHCNVSHVGCIPGLGCAQHTGKPGLLGQAALHMHNSVPACTQ
jgi:hypothetical protein